ncbi:S9 family peptidase [Halioxenophilus sp. WMMB6]|uniref:S9 family peptidase n=1 Tax=Halioxenophilus sp. WMMB6 TaxID=3073815 RepID=UPI00295F2367|nr:DPP IV N-terminal domain-containing protein [Halioxenophilus sp. WMMB6]
MRFLPWLLLPFTAVASAQEQPDYARSMQFTPDALKERIYSTRIDPHWEEGGQRFWYGYETSESTSYWLVQPIQTPAKVILVNTGDVIRRLQASATAREFGHIGRLNVTGYDFQHQIVTLETECSEPAEPSSENSAAGCMKVEVDYDRARQKILSVENSGAEAPLPDWASLSPDGSTVVYIKEANLFMMSVAELRSLQSGETDHPKEVRLTDDGEVDYSFSGAYHPPEFSYSATVPAERSKALVQWSPDSRYVSIVRYDNREVEKLWVIDSLSQSRPQLVSYPYAMPGEDHVPQAELWLFDLNKRRSRKIRTEKFVDQYLIPMVTDPDAEGVVRWRTDSHNHLFFYRVSRDMKQAEIVQLSPKSGKIKVLHKESTNRYLTYHPYYRMILDLPFYAFNDGSSQLIWSTQSGWGQLFLVNDGDAVTPVTQGRYQVMAIEAVDEAAGVVFFRARGVDPKRNPHYEYLYRINLDGTGLTELNAADGTTTVELSPDHSVFVSNVSDISSTPYSSLISSTGQQLLQLEQADVSRLKAIDFTWPERVSLVAADGQTRLYGAMYLPSNFDSTRQYPLLVNVYPGPQSDPVPKTFEDRSFGADFRFLAEQGYVVVTVENRGGSPDRGVNFRSISSGNFRDYGLQDIAVAVQQLGQQYSFIDPAKIGIYGGSGGGFMSTAALLQYPDVFKVAVSEFGNHTNDIYNNWWGEIHNGLTASESTEGNVEWIIDIQKNTDIADQLQGRLLLATGDVDTNVHPANTYRLIHELIRQNKRFDFFLFPGQSHGFRGHDADYFRVLRADYFNRYLKGRTQPLSVAIPELPEAAGQP